MATNKNVVIRTAERLNAMGELGKVLKTLGSSAPGALVAKDEIPVVYQFNKGANGESVNAPQKNVIGKATNIRIDEETGDLVGDITISHMVRLADNFNGTIDNLVVAKNSPISKSKNKKVVIKDKGSTYELVNLVVYDKLITSATKREQATNKAVEKTYVAPTEVYDVSPLVGERLAKQKEVWDKEFEEVTNSTPWKHQIRKEETGNGKP